MLGTYIYIEILYDLFKTDERRYFYFCMYKKLLQYNNLRRCSKYSNKYFLLRQIFYALHFVIVEWHVPGYRAF